MTLRQGQVSTHQRCASRRSAPWSFAPSRSAIQSSAPRRSAPSRLTGRRSACRRSGFNSGFCFRHSFHASTPCRMIFRCSLGAGHTTNFLPHPHPHRGRSRWLKRTPYARPDRMAQPSIPASAGYTRRREQVCAIDQKRKSRVASSCLAGLVNL